MTLHLRRRVGQAIRIGPDIVITIESVKAHDVRLAIDAPGLRVDRLEVHEIRKGRGEDGASAK